MGERMRNRNAIVTNLLDAGCDDVLTESCLAHLEAGEVEAALDLLARHRRHLLDCCHAEERKISCLDYLIHQLNQSERRK